MGNTFGYLSSYTKNSDGTFNGILTCSDGNLPVVCYGFLNLNNLVSPNDKTQMVVMSSDNKYIFLVKSVTTATGVRETSPEQFKNFLAYYYTSVAAKVNYNTGIPLFSVYMGLGAAEYTGNDSTLNSITDNELKKIYKGYLLGLNPPQSVFDNAKSQNITITQSNCKDVAYYALIMYKILLFIKNNPTAPKLSNGFPVGNGIIPDNACIQTDTTLTSPVSIITSNDCKNIQSGIPVFPRNSNLISETDQTTNNQGGAALGGSSLSSSSCCCFIIFVTLLLIVFSASIGSAAGKAARKRR